MLTGGVNRLTDLHITLTGIGQMMTEFVEFVSADPERLHRLFTAFGFSRVMRHATRAIDLNGSAAATKASFAERDIVLA